MAVTHRATLVLARKELRELLPLWTVAMAGIVLAWSSDVVTPAVLFFAPSAILGTLAPIALGAMVVGHEFRYHTLTTVLSLPVSRRRVLAAKALVLGILLCILAATAWSAGARTPWLWLPIACGFCLAPCFTLLTRNELAGMVFAGAVPATLLLAGDLIAGGLTLMPGADEMAVALRNRIVGVGTAIACVLAVAGAAWRFLSLDVAEGRSARALFRSTTSHAGGVTRRPTNVYIALLRKELRLQALPLATATLIAGAVGLLRLLAGPDTREAIDRMVLALGPLLAALMAILSGAVASAQERHLGTWSWQLLMPVPLWRQWAIKTVVVSSLAFAYGVVLSGADASTWRFSYSTIVRVSLPQFAVAAALIALYVSSLTQRAVTALLITSAGVVVSSLVFAWFNAIVSLPLFFGTSTFFRARLASGAIGNNDAHLAVAGISLVLFVAPLVIGAWFAMRNHATLDHSWRRIGRQVAVVALAVAVCHAGVTTARAFADAVVRVNWQR